MEVAHSLTQSGNESPDCEHVTDKVMGDQDESPSQTDFGPSVSDASELEDAAFSCSRCQAVYADHEAGKLHESSDESQRHWPGHQCCVCGLGFDDFQVRVQHELQDHDFQNDVMQSATCTICATECNSLAEVTPHMREVHYSATGDLEGVSSMDDIDDVEVTFSVKHDEACDQVSDDQLNVCQESESSVLDVVLVESEQAESIESEVVVLNTEGYCELCKKKFAQTGGLLQHLNSKHGVPFCRQCEKTFSSKSDQLQHMRLKHKNPVCLPCEKFFKNQEDLAAHLEAGHGTVETKVNSASNESLQSVSKSLLPDTRWFQCFVCQADCSSAKDYSRHVEGAHKACPLCHRAFDQQQALEQHLKSIHPGEEAGANKKQSSAVSKALLQGIDWAGVDMHSSLAELRPQSFNCRTCGCDFPRMTALLQHEKAKHGTSACFLCEKAFKDRRGMLQHFCMKHNVPVCLECELKFTNTESHHQHVMKEHDGAGIEPVAPASLPTGDITYATISPETSAVLKSVTVCKLCCKMFNHQEALYQHNRDKHPDLYTCDVCELNFPNEQALEQHNKDTHISIYSCRPCNRDFANEQALEQHNRDKHGPVYSCAPCNRDFPNEQSLEQHNRDKHAPVYSCAPCDKEFPNEQALEQHTRDKHAPLYSCAPCNRDFPNEQALEQHTRDKHAPLYTPLCAACNRGFPNEEALEQHNKVKHAPLYSCEACDREFPNELALEQHNRVKHAPLYNCAPCNRDFSNEQALEQHNRDKHAPLYNCAPCNRDFPNEQALEQNNIDQCAPPISCALCNWDFPNEQALEQHVRDKHAPPFSCALCNRDFPNEQALDQHTRDKHTPLFSCTPCNKDFPNEQALGQHNKDKHAPLYSCDICDDDFPNEQALEEHITDNHPLVKRCSDCGKVFKSDLHAYICHMRDKHQISVEPDEAAATATDDNPDCSSAEGSQSTSLLCPVCKHVCRGLTAVGQHLKDKHPSIEQLDLSQSSLLASPRSDATPELPMPSFHCPMCQLGFNSLRDAGQHIRDRHGTLDCPVCKMTSKDHEGLYQHIQDKHGGKLQTLPDPGGEEFRCPTCKHICKSEAGVQQHMNDKHEGALCTECDVKFVSLQDLLQHLQLSGHGESIREVENAKTVLQPPQSTSEVINTLAEDTSKSTPSTSFTTQLICPACHSSFTDAGDLIEHVQTVHSRPTTQTRSDLVCLSCILTFNTKEELEEHKKLRHGNFGVDPASHAVSLQEATLQRNYPLGLEGGEPVQSKPLSYSDALKKKTYTEFKEQAQSLATKAVKRVMPARRSSTQLEMSPLEESLPFSQQEPSALALAPARQRTRSLHSYIIRDSKGNYQCSLCDMVAAGPQKITMHIVYDHGISMSEAGSSGTSTSQPFACSFCQRGFGTQKGLTKHVKQKVCLAMDSTLSSSAMSQRASSVPNLTHVGQGQGRQNTGKSAPVAKGQFQCKMPDCGQILSCKAAQCQHMFDKHGVFQPTGAQNDVCKICGKKTPSVMAFYQHMDAHRRAPSPTKPGSKTSS